MKPTAEKRFFPGAEVRVKPNADGSDSNILAGYALLYNSFSEDLGGFREAIRPGAFTESLKTADIRCLIDHKPELLLGRNTAGTLRLADDATGLGFEDDLPDTSYARDLKPSVARRDKTGMSFGFYCEEAEWSFFPGDETGELLLRTIVRAEIFEISCVTFPAYPDTTAAVRSRDHYRQGLAKPGPSAELRARQLRDRLALSRRLILD